MAGYGSIHADGGSNWSVTGNKIDNGDYGIFLNGVGGTNLIDSNQVGLTSGGYTITADGVRAVGTSGLTISNNIIGNNTGIDGDGIHVEKIRVVRKSRITIPIQHERCRRLC